MSPNLLPLGRGGRVLRPWGALLRAVLSWVRMAFLEGIGVLEPANCRLHYNAVYYITISCVCYINDIITNCIMRFVAFGSFWNQKFMLTTDFSTSSTAHHTTLTLV